MDVLLLPPYPTLLEQVSPHSSRCIEIIRYMPVSPTDSHLLEGNNELVLCLPRAWQ